MQCRCPKAQLAISPSQLFFSHRIRAPIVTSSFKFLVARLGNFSFRSCTSLSFFSSLNPSPRLVRPLFQNSFDKLFSTCPRFLFFCRAPSMEKSPKRQGKVMFSAKSSGENKEILVQHLLVGEKELELLIELEHRIAGGELLSDLAVQYSICPSKEKGGMLGWVRRGQLVPEFGNAAFCTSLNKVVRCKTQYGWHLLEILSEREESTLEDIEPLDLHSKMQDPNFIKEAQLIDVREQEEIAKASLPGFKVLPLLQFGTWGSVITDEFDPEKEIYVLCHHGVRSMQVAKWLQTQGFKRVFNVAGGIHAYSLNVDPSVPTY